MIQNKLPKNWQIKKLGEICNFIGGGTPSKAVLNYWNGNIPWASIKDIKGQYLTKTSDFITDEGLKKSATNLANPNEIILATRINPGKPIITKIQTSINQDLKIVRPKIEIDNSFLYYLFLNIENDIIKLSNGTTVLGITLNSLNDIDIKLPNLPTQQAIVSKIEELFSELDKGIEDLKTAQQQLKTYRQSLLKWAFEGKLTTKKVKDGVLPKEWRLENLNKISKIVSGFAFKSSDFTSSGIPVVKISNVGYSEFVWKDQQYLPKEFLLLNSDFVLKGGDLLIALTRPITNDTTKICRFPQNTDAGLLNQRVACIKEFKINENFLFLYFQTNMFKEYIRSKFSETLQPNLSPKDLALTPIPVCSIEEQHLIVQEIESRLSVADKMEESIAQSLLQAEALRQSILKKAFSGELV